MADEIMTYAAMRDGLFKKHTRRNKFSSGGAPSVDKRFACTPLHFAARCGHAKSCQSLLDSGALPDIKADTGVNAMHLACMVKASFLLLCAYASMMGTY